MIGIIGAMKQEVDQLLSLMKVTEDSYDCGYHFYKGLMADKDVVVVQGGIGKVNASLSAAILLKDYPIDYVINIGSAGGLKEQENIGDIIIGEKVIHHDFDLTGFGRPIGQVPDMPHYFEADSKMIELAHQILEKNNQKAFIGVIASGDQFVCREDQVRFILKNIPDALCAEMEAASIAQICFIFKKPFLITRGISDVYNKGSNSIQFDQYLEKASRSSALMCYEMVKAL